MALDEDLEQAGKEIPFQETTEMGEIMKNLDDDKQDRLTKMSNIDFNTRLSSFEINNIMIVDELIRLGILPEDIGLTRQKKRLSISTQGWGRETKVKIIQGEREHRRAGIGEKIGGLFSRRP